VRSATDDIDDIYSVSKLSCNTLDRLTKHYTALCKVLAARSCILGFTIKCKKSNNIIFSTNHALNVEMYCCPVSLLRKFAKRITDVAQVNFIFDFVKTALHYVSNWHLW